MSGSMHRNEERIALNEGRPVYNVCKIMTTEPVLGIVSLHADGYWYVDGDRTQYSSMIYALRKITDNNEMGR